MEKEIISAIVCSGGAFIAAIKAANHTKKEKYKSTTITQHQIFTLGTNIANLGWTKVAPNSVRKDILSSTISLLRELNFPQEIERELESFSKKKEGIRELQESLQCIKKRIGMQVASRFGRKYVGYYNIGFNMKNVAPILQHASMNIDEAGQVAAESMHGIEGDASALGLPTKNLKAICKLVDKGLSLHNGKIFGQARLGLLKVGQNYIDILEGK